MYVQKALMEYLLLGCIGTGGRQAPPGQSLALLDGAPQSRQSCRADLVALTQAGVAGARRRLAAHALAR